MIGNLVINERHLLHYDSTTKLSRQSQWRKLYEHWIWMKKITKVYYFIDDSTIAVIEY